MVIYLDLRRQGYKISYYFTSDGYEVDFVVQSPLGEIKLLQVVWDMQDPQTMKREKRALTAAMKELNAQGEVITLDAYLREEVNFL